MADETMADQQKKRRMEALERKFAQANVEIHQQQHKKQEKRCYFNKRCS